MKPIEHGANIIIHSLTKWMGGHGIAIGGAVVDGGNFDWGKDDRFPTIAGPHYAMNDINFFEELTRLPSRPSSAQKACIISARPCHRQMHSISFRVWRPAPADAATYGQHSRDAGIPERP